MGITYASIADKVKAKVYDGRLNLHDEAVLAQALVLAEEAGEFAKELRRLLYLSRDNGGPIQTHLELADIVISAYVMAELLGCDLDEAVSNKLSKIQERGGI